MISKRWTVDFGNSGQCPEKKEPNSRNWIPLLKHLFFSGNWKNFPEK